MSIKKRLVDMLIAAVVNYDWQAKDFRQLAPYGLNLCGETVDAKKVGSCLRLYEAGGKLDVIYSLITPRGSLTYGDVEKAIIDGYDDSGDKWPDYCDLPITIACDFLVRNGAAANRAIEYCAELTACYSWRKNKTIYRFDNELIRTMAEQAGDMTESDILPAELLFHLPYPCVYIHAPGLTKNIDGFFAWVEYDFDRNTPELRIQWMLHTYDKTFPQVLHLLRGKTIEDCVKDTLEATQGVNVDDVYNGVDDIRLSLTAVQMLLYLVSDNADIKKVTRKKGRASGAKPKTTEINVGVRIGAAMKKARLIYERRESLGGTKRPHSRRGHWHHYWAGSVANGDRRLILKWTAPTFIHSSDNEVVIRPVRKEN